MFHQIKNRENKGFTLIELMISIVIISIALIPMLTMFDLGASSQKRGEMELIALNLGQSEMEKIISTFYQGESISSYSDTKNGFNINTTVTPNGKMKKINVTVSYMSNNQNRSISLTTEVVNY